MAMTPDAKKYLLIGGGVGALAIFAGSWLLGSRRAFADPKLPGGRAHEGHDRHEKRHQDRDVHDENQRGEYGRKKKHHHKRHGHGG